MTQRQYQRQYVMNETPAADCRRCTLKTAALGTGSVETSRNCWKLNFTFYNNNRDWFIYLPMFFSHKIKFAGLNPVLAARLMRHFTVAAGIQRPFTRRMFEGNVNDGSTTGRFMACGGGWLVPSLSPPINRRRQRVILRDDGALIAWPTGRPTDRTGDWDNGHWSFAHQTSESTVTPRGSRCLRRVRPCVAISVFNCAHEVFRWK